jgi:hypothetical protein
MTAKGRTKVQLGRKLREKFAIGTNIDYSEFNTKAAMDCFLVADRYVYRAAAGIL